MKTGDFYKLTEDNGGFKKGTIVLLGDTETMEFFDITTELTTGHSYSSYSIDLEFIERLNDKQQSSVRDLFYEFVKDNYKLSNKILTY